MFLGPVHAKKKSEGFQRLCGELSFTALLLGRCWLFYYHGFLVFLNLGLGIVPYIGL